MINEDKIKSVLDQFDTVKVDQSDTPYKITPDDWNKIKAMYETFTDLEIYEALKDAREFARTIARIDAPTNFSTKAKTYLQTYYGEDAVAKL